MHPEVAVALSTFREKYLDWVINIIDALDKQTIKTFQTIIIVNANMHYYERLLKAVKDKTTLSYDLEINFNPIDKGIANSRNIALTYAKTPYIAYIDDDVIPHPHWLEELLHPLKQNEKVGAVTGPVLCKWEQDTENYASWFPQELYWILGCTSRNIKQLTVVRNGFASNLALRREVLLKNGGFNENLGYNQQNPIAGEETAIGIDLLRSGYVTLWNPEAIVYHRVFKERLRMRRILTRSFIEGKTKAYINRAYGRDVIKTEENHLQSIIRHFIKTRYFKSKALLFHSTLAVLIGYLAYRTLGFNENMNK